MFAPSNIPLDAFDKHVVANEYTGEGVRFGVKTLKYMDKKEFEHALH